MRTLLHSIFDQPDAESVVAQYGRVLDALVCKTSKVAEHLDAARDELLAFTAFPKEIWRPIWFSNGQQRLKQRDPASHGRGGSLPRPHAIISLFGAVLVEQHDEWIAVQALTLP